jgi:hypothetical protein
VRRDKIHSQEPLDEWQLGILEDSAYQAREILATVLTTELTVFASHTVMTATVRTNNITISPSTFDDGLLALLVRGEIRGEGDNAIELLEIYHNTWSFLFKF